MWKTAIAVPISRVPIPSGSGATGGFAQTLSTIRRATGPFSRGQKAISPVSAYTRSHGNAPVDGHVKVFMIGICMPAKISAHVQQRFREAMEQGTAIPEPEWQHLIERVGVTILPCGSMLFREGDVVRCLYFIARGLLRLFWTNSNGREINSGFDYEDRFMTDVASFFTGVPARFAIQALEDCELLYFDHATYEHLLTRHVCWERLWRRQLETQFVRKVDKELRIRTLTAQQRYRLLVNQASPLLERVPQYHLASYLGIAPETLSRIRARNW